MMQQSQRGWYTRLSHPLQSMINYGIVLGMLIILALILFPVLARPHHGSRYPSCFSNEKLICLGLLQYAQDYDEQFPCGTRVNRLGSRIVRDTPQQAKLHAGQGWAGAIMPYVKNVKVFACPNAAEGDSKIGEPIKIGGDGKKEIQLWSVTYVYTGDNAANAKAPQNNAKRQAAGTGNLGALAVTYSTK